MANSLSAKKRIRQNVKQRVRNRARKSMVNTQIKHFEACLAGGDTEKAGEQYLLLVKKLDKVATTSTLHKNTAGRIKSRLGRKLNKLKSSKS